MFSMYECILYKFIAYRWCIWARVVHAIILIIIYCLSNRIFKFVFFFIKHPYEYFIKFMRRVENSRSIRCVIISIPKRDEEAIIILLRCSFFPRKILFRLEKMFQIVHTEPRNMRISWPVHTLFDKFF